VGLQFGTLACIGKAMGEGNADKGRSYLKMAVATALVFNLLVAFVVQTFKGPLAYLFTSN